MFSTTVDIFKTQVVHLIRIFALLAIPTFSFSSNVRYKTGFFFFFHVCEGYKTLVNKQFSSHLDEEHDNSGTSCK